MIVDPSTLMIKPIADRLLGRIAGEITNEVICGDIALNNELALHVVELKTNGPVPHLEDLDQRFHEQILSLNNVLVDESAELMPTGMHPFFVPDENVALWPHGDQVIYQTYHKIFNCSGHGWSNLQSVHINLPFNGDDEFAKLHNAIRLVLPLIPALTASTPFAEGELSQALDSRLLHYGQNQAKLPEISGDIIPEFVTSEAEYQERILKPMYQAIAPFDAENILQEEWLNSRAAIARFDRSAIEIRIMDIQESPIMDVACIALITGLIEIIVQNTSEYLNAPMENRRLKQIYQDAIFSGMETVITDQAYLDQFGLGFTAPLSARTLWAKVLQHRVTISERYKAALGVILSQGNLAERMKRSYQKAPSQQAIVEIYQQLCRCLKENRPFQ